LLRNKALRFELTQIATELTQEGEPIFSGARMEVLCLPKKILRFFDPLRLETLERRAWRSALSELTPFARE
jgi:hypothetical protein